MLLLLQGTFNLYFDLVWKKFYNFKAVVAKNHPSEYLPGFGSNGNDTVYLVELEPKNPGTAMDLRYVLMRAVDIMVENNEVVSNFY